MAAIEADPSFADAFSNMGNVFKALGQYDEAISCVSTAMQLQPGYADACSNLAFVYKDTGDIMNAIATYRKALQMYKEQTAVARQPSLVAPDALAYCNLVHCLQMVCDWSKRDAHFASVRRIIDAQLEASETPAVQPHHALVYPLRPDLQLEIAKRYARSVQETVAALG